MRRIALAMVVVFLAAPIALAQDKTGAQVVDEMVSGISQGNLLMQLTMKIVSKSGQTRERALRSRMKEDNGLGKSIITFESPEDVKGTKFLLVENKGRDDDQLLYLPALKKVRRVAGSQRSQSFMGTDFTYSDLETHDATEGEHARLADEKVNGADCYVVETTPKPSVNSEYSKVKYWVRKDNMVVVKADFFDKSGAQVKALVTDQLDEYKPGKWMPKYLKMSNLQKGTSTEIFITKYQFDAKIADDFFTERFLQDESQF